MSDLSEINLGKHKKFRFDKKKLAISFLIVAAVVAFVVFWWLKLTGITITGEAFCGLDEHTHSEECYVTELICTLGTETTTREETTEETVTDDTALTSVEEDMPTEKESETSSKEETTEAQTTHTHTDECYKKVLTCQLVEHIHSAECYPDVNADLETESQWRKTFESVEITDNVANNMLEIAKTQIGYTESRLNFQYDIYSGKNGYTRYGDWYGSEYGGWSAIFVSFCLNYSNAANAMQLSSAGAEAMRNTWNKADLYSDDKNYTPSRGSVAFFDSNADGAADYVGIVVSFSENLLIVIEGDRDDAVTTVTYDDLSTVIGYGLTENIAAADPTETTTADDTSANGKIELNGQVYSLAAPIGNNSTSDIIYESHLESELINIVIKDINGIKIESGSVVYIGERYEVSLEFSEINTGSQWIQFEHNADGYLTFHIPDTLDCEPFDSWHPISAKTEAGTVEDVGEYYVNDDGLVLVRFFEDANGINFVDKYSNVDFVINFGATIAKPQSGTTTEIQFNDKIKVELDVDGGAAMTATKTHGEFDSETNTVDYTIRIEATHGVVKDLKIEDEIYENHHVLMDTIVVTDLDGNVLNPQPTISECNVPYAIYGFSMTDFPDFAAGDGFLITYKSQINDAQLSQETVGMWNGLSGAGKDSNNTDVSFKYTDDWLQVELDRIKKNGKQSVVEDANGNPISVIEWDIIISKTNNNLDGTLVIDTLGDGLAYYQGKEIYIRCYDEWGYYLNDVYVSWDDVTIEGNTMSFDLPSGYAFDIVYYTTHEALDEGEMKEYSNTVTATINGKTEGTTGSADVIGFIPRVEKNAKGDDGKYVYYTVEADVPAIIKDWGNFTFSDLSAVWSYNNNDAGYLYVQNLPEDLVVKAVTESGKTITFSPYITGGPTENTYILVAPADGDMHHSFKLYFNTSNPSNATSKWILDEDAVLTITYKTPFDAKTGTEWTGELTGDKTLGDVLLEGYQLSNESYVNYTNVISGTDTENYKYSPMITKKAVAHEDGTIDYTVTFHGSIPGFYGNSGYLNGTDSVFFLDTFDEKLEYVPGSLMVTCYNPWTTHLWVSKFKYDGAITGNTIRADAKDFKREEINPNSALNYDWIATFPTYYSYVQQLAGEHVFTYTLKLKDEYLYSTDHSVLELDNTAEVIWDDDGTSGPANETVEFMTGLLDKAMVKKDSKLEFDLHINRQALDILPGSDTLTIIDTMTPNLSIYWNSIKLLYEDTQGNWIDFDSPGSAYQYTVTYDPVNNSLTFIVPDSLHIRIDYTTLITESGYVSINNSVRIDGKAEVTDAVDAIYRVDDHSGDASGSNNQITLLKQDGLSYAPLPGATFLLYGPMGDPSAVLPQGAQAYIIADNGTVLRYIGSYTTGADGTVYIETQYLTFGGPYAFVETVSPDGYDLLETPVYFYFYETDPDGIIPTVTTLIAIENYTFAYIIPGTGNIGTLPTAIVGVALIVTPILYSIIRRKRERRFN